ALDLRVPPLGQVRAANLVDGSRPERARELALRPEQPHPNAALAARRHGIALLEAKPQAPTMTFAALATRTLAEGLGGLAATTRNLFSASRSQPPTRVSRPGPDPRRRAVLPRRGEPGWWWGSRDGVKVAGKCAARARSSYPRGRFSGPEPWCGRIGRRRLRSGARWECHDREREGIARSRG